MLANCMYFIIPWKSTALADVHANYVETPIASSASKTVHAFQHTDSFDLRVVLCVRKPRLAGHVAF